MLALPCRKGVKCISHWKHHSHFALLFRVGGGSLQIITIAKPLQNWMSSNPKSSQSLPARPSILCSPHPPSTAIESSQRRLPECGRRENGEAYHTQQRPNVMWHTHVDQPQTNPCCVMRGRAACIMWPDCWPALEEGVNCQCKLQCFWVQCITDYIQRCVVIN